MIFYKKYEPLLYLNDSKYHEIVLTGGRLSGKTTHASIGVLLACLKGKKKVCCFRETKDTIDASIKSELENIIDRDFNNCGFEVTATEIRHANGSVIFFKGLKDVNTQSIEAIKGLASSTDIFLIDEAQAVSKSVLDVLIPTLRKDGCVLIAIYNRISDELPIEEALFLDYDFMKSPETTYFVEVNYPELTHLGLISDRALQRADLLRVNKPDEYNEIYLNKVRPREENAVVKYFSNDNINDDITYCDDLPLHLTCDYNVGAMSWALFHTDERKRKFYFFDEIAVANTNTQSCIDEFLKRYPNHKNEIVINSDASGRSRKTSADYSDIAIINNALIKHGYNVRLDIPRANPPKQNRINAFNNMIMDNNGIRHILVHSNCQEIVKACKLLKYKKGTSIIDEMTSRQLEIDDRMLFCPHMFDAISYPAEFYNPIYID